MTRELEDIKNILLQKKQIILQGAPGTGKTYNTASIALSILGIPFDSTNHKDIMAKYEIEVKNKNIYFTTFHQSMDYEDFIEGLKPEIVENGKGVIYRVENGIFKQICINTPIFQIGDTFGKYKIIDVTNEIITIEKPNGNWLPISIKWLYDIDNHLKNYNISFLDDGRLPDLNENKYHIEPYLTNGYPNIIPSLIEKIRSKNDCENKPKVLIIDEINRGNISKIFGELITLLEVDKRQQGEHSICAILPYSKEKFSIPSNVYIIGTMNTTDRSVGYIDYAIRRRFAFYTLKANEDAISQYYFDRDESLKEKSLTIFQEIHKFIKENKSPDLDVEDLMVGHSYFMAKTESELKLKLQCEIIPLLKEYDKDGILILKDEIRQNIGVSWLSILR